MPNTPEVICRFACVVIVVAASHQFDWEWLRFATSEMILRMSAALCMVTERISSDTISIHGNLTRFVISCTFVDVFVGAIPLLWELKRSLVRNLETLVIFAAGLFALNLVRLEITQVLHAGGVSWTLADTVLGGVVYFLV